MDSYWAVLAIFSHHYYIIILIPHKNPFKLACLTRKSSFNHFSLRFQHQVHLAFKSRPSDLPKQFTQQFDLYSLLLLRIFLASTLVHYLSYKNCYISISFSCSCICGEGGWVFGVLEGFLKVLKLFKKFKKIEKIKIFEKT